MCIYVLNATTNALIIGITEFLCNAAREAKRNDNASALVFSFLCVMTTHQVPEGLRQSPS